MAGAHGVFIYLNRPFTASIKANIKQMKGTGANGLCCLRKLCNAEKSVSKEDRIQHHCKPWNTFFWYSCVTHIELQTCPGKKNVRRNVIYPYQEHIINQRGSTFKAFDGLYIIFNVPGVNSESACLVFCLGALNHTAFYISLYPVLMFRVQW